MSKHYTKSSHYYKCHNFELIGNKAPQKKPATLFHMSSSIPHKHCGISTQKVLFVCLQDIQSKLVDLSLGFVTEDDLPITTQKIVDHSGSMILSLQAASSQWQPPFEEESWQKGKFVMVRLQSCVLSSSNRSLLWETKQMTSDMLTILFSLHSCFTEKAPGSSVEYP